MGDRLENKVAVVTGSSSGNGRAIAPFFSSETNRQRRIFDEERDL